METSELKKEIIDRINSIDDEKQLLQIEALLEGLVTNVEIDFWDELPDSVKKEIEEAEKELTEGKGIPHAQVMAEIKARFNIGS